LIAKSAGPISVTASEWATQISMGPANESYQSVAFTVGVLTTDNARLFDNLPIIGPSGTLSYSIAAGQTGSAAVQATLIDSGGVADGGSDRSTQTFLIAVGTPPTVSISTPASNATVNAQFQLAATATDADGSVAVVHFYAGGAAIASAVSANSTFSLNVNCLGAGQHTLTAVAVDNQGFMAQSAPVTVTVSAPSAVALPTNAYAWYRAQTNANDTLGGFNATLVQAPGTLNNVQFSAGEAGQGFYFDGYGSYVRLPDNLFGSVAPSGTFEAWFKTPHPGVILNQTAVDFELYANSPSSYVPALYVGTDGLLYARMFWDANAGGSLVSGSRVDDGMFHHVAVTFDSASSTETLYVDGLAAGSRSFTQVGYSSGYHYQLGNGYTTGWPAAITGYMPFNGTIDEVTIYGRALSASEVQGIFNACEAGKVVPAAGAGLAPSEPLTTTEPPAHHTGRGH
jgi:hypothetical protein